MLFPSKINHFTSYFLSNCYKTSIFSSTHLMPIQNKEKNTQERASTQKRSIFTYAKLSYINFYTIICS